MIIGVSGKIGSGKDTVGAIIQYLTTPLNEGTTLAEFYEHEWKAKKSAWQIKKFADKLKECVSIILDIPREDLEKIEVKNRVLGEEWNYAYFQDDILTVSDARRECENEMIRWDNKYEQQYTVRDILQRFGTDACRNQIHPNFWVNALFSGYKKIASNWDADGNTTVEAYPNWIITDMRFSNELEAVKSRGGITIRCNRYLKTQEHLIRPRAGGLVGMTDSHPSETALDNAAFDYVLDNNGTIEELIVQVKEILIKEKII